MEGDEGVRAGGGGMAASGNVSGAGMPCMSAMIKLLEVVPFSFLKNEKTENIGKGMAHRVTKKNGDIRKYLELLFYMCRRIFLAILVTMTIVQRSHSPYRGYRHE